MAVCSWRVCEAHLLLAKVRVAGAQTTKASSPLDLVDLLNYHVAPLPFSLSRLESSSIKNLDVLRSYLKEPDDSKSSGSNHQTSVVVALAR